MVWGCQLPPAARGLLWPRNTHGLCMSNFHRFKYTQRGSQYSCKINPVKDFKSSLSMHCVCLLMKAGSVDSCQPWYLELKCPWSKPEHLSLSDTKARWSQAGLLIFALACNHISDIWLTIVWEQEYLTVLWSHPLYYYILMMLYIKTITDNDFIGPHFSTARMKMVSKCVDCLRDVSDSDELPLFMYRFHRISSWK